MLPLGGVGTTDPVRKPAPLPSGRSGSPLVAGILPLLLALAAAAGAQASGHPAEMDVAAAVLATVGVLIPIARPLRRR